MDYNVDGILIECESNQKNEKVMKAYYESNVNRTDAAPVPVEEEKEGNE